MKKEIINNKHTEILMNIAGKKRLKIKILPFILFLIVGRQFFSSKLFPSTTIVKLKLVLVKV